MHAFDLEFALGIRMTLTGQSGESRASSWFRSRRDNYHHARNPVPLFIDDAAPHFITLLGNIQFEVDAGGFSAGSDLDRGCPGLIEYARIVSGYALTAPATGVDADHVIPGRNAIDPVNPSVIGGRIMGDDLLHHSPNGGRRGVRCGLFLVRKLNLQLFVNCWSAVCLQYRAGDYAAGGHGEIYSVDSLSVRGEDGIIVSASNEGGRENLDFIRAGGEVGEGIVAVGIGGGLMRGPGAGYAKEDVVAVLGLRRQQDLSI